LPGDAVSSTCTDLAIDDVVVHANESALDLDVRLRNTGTDVVNVTRAYVDRRGAVTCRECRGCGMAGRGYGWSARYRLNLAESDMVSVNHRIEPGDVDAFVLSLRDEPCWYRAELYLRYNASCWARSEAFKVDFRRLSGK